MTAIPGDRDGGASVLIVDDSTTNIDVLDEILGPTYRTFFATSGAEALSRAREAVPDLILLDVIMPGMDGHETCRRLREQPETKDIPVIFITSLDTREDEERGLEIGAVDYITKPFSPAIVRLRVKTHIELKRQRDLLEALSQVDSLTGVSNRRAFDQILARAWTSQTRHHTPLSLAMIDVDHFKPYNDSRGHAAGDACLTLIAQGIAEALHRPEDTVSRYGGEEFVCVLPNTDPDGAARVAERIQAAIRALAIPHGASPTAPHVTLSLGLATTIPGPEGTAQALLAAADGALYRAKAEGRNRWALAAPLGT
jgi:diguanylate cyclase (GGDEF)-like protein